MDFLNVEFWMALLSIVIIDLVLAGDNAIVIGLAARNVRKEEQTKVIIGGTVGAVVIRVAATLLVTYLLMIPGLRLIGGMLLIWIAYKLLVEEKKHEISAGSQMWAAIRTIIIADAMMGLDNVLAVAGAAHGDTFLVILGLAISVPIMVWGSTIILKLTDRFPFIIVAGAAVLAYTAAKMIVLEPMIHTWFLHPAFKYSFELLVVVAVVLFGWQVKKKQGQQAQKQDIIHPKQVKIYE